MNICFVACFNKTIFFHNIAKVLEETGINIFWISVSQKWTNYLIDNGTLRENILQLQIGDDYQFDINRVHRTIEVIEKENLHTFKQVYYMDRVLREKPWSEVSLLFSYIIAKVEHYLVEHYVKIVFGETTAAHEVLISMLCKTIEKKYLKPHTIRMPDNRFVFFDGHLENEIFKLKSDDFTLEKSSNYLLNYKEKKPKPYYFQLNNENSNYANLNFFHKKIEKVKDMYLESKTNFSEKSFYHHLFIEKKYLRAFSKYKIKKEVQFHTIEKRERYVLFTMHVQPEASIDVLGIENNNQYELIKILATNLPFAYTLLVKEHSNALGQKDAKYLQNIAKIPGVLLVDPFQNTSELLEYVDLTYTVSGTIGIEASILGKKSVTLSPMFYNILPNSFFDKNPFNIKSYLEKVDDTNKEELDRSFYQYSQYTHKGFVSDPVSLPYCTSPKNIKDVSKAFLKLLSTL